MILTRRTFGLVALAQSSGSAVFVPDAAPPSTAKGRSPDRKRDPSAWGIGDDQWGLFQAFAATHKRPLKAIIRLNSLRARQFKDDLAELLTSIPGWEVEDQGVYTAGSLPAFDGILIQNRSAVEPSPEGLLIKQALDAAGIEPEARFDATQPVLLRILIGSPPRN